MHLRPLVSRFRLLPVAMCCLATLPALTSAREMRTIYLPGAGKAIEKAFLVNASEHLQIEFPQRNLSPAVELPPGDLQLVVLPELPAKGQSIPKEAPVIRIPESWERCIVVFLGNPENPVIPVRAIPLHFGGEDFALGNTLYTTSRLPRWEECLVSKRSS